MRRRSDGFTLLELLVVVLIIGLLAGFVAPKYFSQIGKSQTQVARAQIDSFDKALDQYRLDTGNYPTSEQGLGALYSAPANEASWKGPYIKKPVPPDPWGKAYIYRQPGTDPKHEFEILSYGKDGKQGGAGDDADVVSWDN